MARISLHSVASVLTGEMFDRFGLLNVELVEKSGFGSVRNHEVHSYGIEVLEIINNNTADVAISGRSLLPQKLHFIVEAKVKVHCNGSLWWTLTRSHHVLGET